MNRWSHKFQSRDLLAFALLAATGSLAYADSSSPHFRITRDATVTASAIATSPNFSTTVAGGTGMQTPPQSSPGYSTTGGDPSQRSTQVFRQGFE